MHDDASVYLDFDRRYSLGGTYTAELEVDGTQYTLTGPTTRHGQLDRDRDPRSAPGPGRPDAGRRSTGSGNTRAPAPCRATTATKGKAASRRVRSGPPRAPDRQRLGLRRAHRGQADERRRQSGEQAHGEADQRGRRTADLPRPPSVGLKSTLQLGRLRGTPAPQRAAELLARLRPAFPDAVDVGHAGGVLLRLPAAVRQEPR